MWAQFPGRSSRTSTISCKATPRPRHWWSLKRSNGMPTYNPIQVVDLGVSAANLNAIGIVSLAGNTVLDVTFLDINEHVIDVNAAESIQITIGTTAKSLAQA